MLEGHNALELNTARAYHGGKSEQDLGEISSIDKRVLAVATKAPGFMPGSLA